MCSGGKARVTPDNEEDLALSRRASRGDGAAFAMLVEKYERPLRAFLARMDSNSADDVAQEAFLRAWRFAGSYDGRARYSTWLTRIAFAVPDRRAQEGAGGGRRLLI